RRGRARDRRDAADDSLGAKARLVFPEETESPGGSFPLGGRAARSAGRSTGQTPAVAARTVRRGNGADKPGRAAERGRPIRGRLGELVLQPARLSRVDSLERARNRAWTGVCEQRRTQGRAGRSDAAGRAAGSGDVG